MKQQWLVAGWLVALMVGSAYGALAAGGDGSRPEREWRYRVQVVAGVGHGTFYHGDTRTFDGPNAYAGMAVRPFPSPLAGLGFAGRIARLDSGGSLEAGDVTIFSALAEYHWGRGRTQLFVSAGIATLAFQRTEVVTYADQSGIQSRESWVEEIRKAGLELGAGFQVAVGQGFFVQPEVRYIDTTAGSGMNLGLPLLQVGFGYAW